jgi:aquaporin Z
MARGSRHLVEYALEGALLGGFLASASVVTAVLQHPNSPVHATIANPLIRRALTGMAMGLTLIAIVYSPAGRRSGAHLNPVVTLSFLRLGKIATADAIGYIAGQFTGAILAMLLLAALMGGWLSDPAVDYVRTVPGPHGEAPAFLAEAVISFGMMLTILVVSNSRYARWTGIAAGILVATYITLESPLSGMSMNPARSAGPALAAGHLMSAWVYFTAPLVGMFAAADLYVRLRGAHRVRCAKLEHDARYRCIFRCGYATAPLADRVTAPLDAHDRTVVHQI